MKRTCSFPTRSAVGGPRTGLSGEQLAFLARAADLLASSSDGAHDLERFTRLVATGPASACLVALLNEEGRLETVASSRVRTDDRELLDEALAEPLRETGRCATVVLGLRSALLAPIA